MKIARVAISLLYSLTVAAQSPITFQYFYDNSGQLIKVVDSTGIAIDYMYDPVGNMTDIKRSAVPVGSLQIFSFTPSASGPLTNITIRGQGFGSTPLTNSVKFNGIQDAVISAALGVLVVQVPPGAAAGPISIMVGSASASSSTPFNISPVPVILGVSPARIVSGTTTVQVSGVNLTGATFSVMPTFNPPLAMVGPVTTNSTGTVSMVPITVTTALTTTASLVIVAHETTHG